MQIQEYLNDKSKTWQLFDREVSTHYDRVADLISLRLYRRWCNALAKALPQNQSLHILDLATGTGAIPIAIDQVRSTHDDQIMGVDLSNEMLDIFRTKLEKNAQLNQKVELQHGDATQLNFEADQFDVVTMACGIRNVSDSDKGMQEILRVLKPGGQVFFLEPAIPRNAILKAIFLGYFRYLVPFVAGFLSNADAYRYFNRSVENFPYGDDFLTKMQSNGFENCTWKKVTLGAGALYIGKKAQQIEVA